jgi:hypothetical protein
MITYNTKVSPFKEIRLVEIENYYPGNREKCGIKKFNNRYFNGDYCRHYIYCLQ